MLLCFRRSGDDPRHPARRCRPSARDGPSGRPASARNRLPALLARLYGKYVAPIVQLTYARRHDDDSYVCYGAYLAFFLTDMTTLSAVLPLSMFLYALLLHRKPRQYWQVRDRTCIHLRQLDELSLSSYFSPRGWLGLHSASAPYAQWKLVFPL